MAGHYSLVCFGELLWDILPTANVAGGAPFNIVNRANALGVASAVISSVGDDPLGKALLSLVEEKGNASSFIQTHPILQTSVVNITVSPYGEPKYDIVKPVAWDDIVVNDINLQLVSDCDVFVYSSLGIRSAASREAMFELEKRARLSVCDINLRDGHYERSTIERMLEVADILRMNEDELSMLSQWMGIESASVERKMELIQEAYRYDTIIVTLGSKGALSLRDGQLIQQAVFKVNVRDTVGSGDAFLAAYLTQRLKNVREQQALRYACAVGAVTASKDGGTPIITQDEIMALLSDSAS